MVPVFADRDAYKAFTGEQAPPFNPDKPVKRWYVTHSMGDRVADATTALAFQTYDIKPDVPVLRQFMLAPADALTVNLPGKYVYPARVVAPSGAFYMLNGEKQYINPTGLATMEEAKELLAELVAAGHPASSAEVVEQARAGMFAIGYEPSEARRIIQITVSGGTYNVGGLLADKHADGVGSPGAWTGPGVPVDWIPAPVMERKGTAGETPVPMRALENGETWQRLPFGLQILNAQTPEGAEEVNEKNLASNVAAIKRGMEKIQAFFGIS